MSAYCMRKLDRPKAASMSLEGVVGYQRQMIDFHTTKTRFPCRQMTFRGREGPERDDQPSFRPRPIYTSWTLVRRELQAASGAINAKSPLQNHKAVALNLTFGSSGVMGTDLSLE